MDPLSDLLRHYPLPELAAAIRSRASEITRVWAEAIRHAIPRMDGKTFDELKDSVPAILEAMAMALSATDDDEIAALVRQSPVQGLTRYRQEYSVTEIMQEDRLLRAIVVTEVEGSLGRQMCVGEAAALHAVIDVMLQRAVVALVDEQQAKLRAAAEKELKYLSFLSHDMNNNLNGVLLSLELAVQQLESTSDRLAVAETLNAARDSIADTVGGMRQLLEHARLRGEATAATGRDLGPVDLYAVAANVVRQVASDARAKGIELTADVPPGTVANGNRELLALVLQNLLGNAIKYSTSGTVRVAAEHRSGPTAKPGCWVVSVSDQGPGIAPDQRAALFEAFRRGEAHGQAGVGLGLAIAAQAAKLQGAELTVDSAVGLGSTFSLCLPDRPASAEPGAWSPPIPASSGPANDNWGFAV